MIKRYLSIEIRNEGLFYVLLEPQRKRIKFPYQRKFIPLLKDDFSSSLKETLLKIKKEEKNLENRIFVTLSLKQTIIHQLNLPKMTVKEIEEVIVGEIEKIPAFSQRAYNYIYSYSPLLEERRIKVIFAVIPQEIIDSVISSAKETGFFLEKLMISPLHLFPLIYSFEKKKEDIGVLVVEEKSSYVIVISFSSCRFFYTSPMGLADLYPSSEKRLNTLVFFNWMDEIKRVFKSYSVEVKKEDIDYLYLIWDSSRGNDLAENLSKELGKEVKSLVTDFIFTEAEESFNPAYFITASPALHQLLKLKEEFPFEKFVFSEKIERTLKTCIVWSMIYFLLVGIVTGKLIINYNRDKKRIISKLQTLDMQISKLNKKTALLQKERLKLLTIKERLLRQAIAVSQLNLISWSEVFAEVANVLPPKLTLSSFLVRSSQQIELKGEALKIEAIAELIRRLQKADLLKNPEFDYLNEEKTEGKTIFKFGIVADLESKDNE